MESVQIRNRDMAWHIAANILFPPNFDAAKSWPAIIAVHPFGSCKEQMICPHRVDRLVC
ncbi:alpha/beta hydrolase [Sphingobium yanoikuyae]|uniref:Alpha/beta hydrolase n=1 Tax=Sphingobium yanoikuyae ATCC 51230 TaxID=883163 RepID=K9CXG6_SPHYA|nr:alpha/beta hydrolase [Sphingobium yanoikuyae]EKU76924.1 hypothetical protein HMPREF9718_00625 [Sphingobium yanoikuyae ATCC 51230]WQE05070.1 alpha/beta hydrolase [Sphingobium yanoikuyae]